MEPNFKNGERLLALNFFKPKSGDVVVIGKSHKRILKRIEHVSGNLFYVLGDNKEKSTDSRHFGLVPKHEMIGKVVLKY